MKGKKKPPRKALLILAIALLSIGGSSIWGTYSKYNRPSQKNMFPEAETAGALPANPREHVIDIIRELNLSAGQWAKLARLGPPAGTMEEREAHGEKIAELLNEEQLARFSKEMRELHYAILNHMMSKMTSDDREEFLRRLERNPDYSPGPPRALLNDGLSRGGSP